MMAATEGIRLQKVLAAAGVGSRRASEILISEGRVEVNGRTVTEQGLRVDPVRDVVRVDGARIRAVTDSVYLVLNKPRGVVSTMSDPQGRPTLAELVAGRPERLFHVGRLDTDTEGLILLTNDGEFAHRMAHPSYEITKTYLAQVAGLVEPATLRRLEHGITLDDGDIHADEARLVDTIEHGRDPRSMVQLSLHSGRNHIVRRMLAAVGHPVLRLSRTAIGPIRLSRLAPGALRELTSDELGTLLDQVEL